MGFFSPHSNPSIKFLLVNFTVTLFVLGLVGYFVPLGHIAYVGSALKLINHSAVYLLMIGYGVLLAAVYVL